MANAKPQGILGSVLALRDIWMDASAKTALHITGSTAYGRITGAISQPRLLASAMIGKARNSAMSQLLGYFSLPSREDVLNVSRRLTNIEMTLDDIGAEIHASRVAAASHANASASVSTAAGATAPDAPARAAQNKAAAARSQPAGEA